MKLISSRCTKLVPLFSPSFFSSEYNTFLANFAQHLSLESPGKITAKIIPIVSDQRCDIPPNLGMYSKLKYDPNNTLFNFWERLVRTINPSVKYSPMNAPNTVPPAQKDSPVLKPAKSASTPKISSKPVKSKEAPTKQEFRILHLMEQVLVNLLALRVRSQEYSGALLLPEVPNMSQAVAG
eukprot:TRINITY_DN26653_c0_g1_i1.p2 TRINITY_DN26653_c0_g1~~TRINITY_DN26653_c0_g1_i1.p2  ORF type:complete len:181 (-),score=45.21 TRINITY_DN26653_c0_g1_i1:2-544(-)